MILTNRMLGDWHEVKALQDRVGENKQEKKAHAAGGAAQPVRLYLAGIRHQTGAGLISESQHEVVDETKRPESGSWKLAGQASL